jgi:alpha-1,2-mannosyltransferase
VSVQFRKQGSLAQKLADIAMMIGAAIALGLATILYARFGFGSLAHIADGSIDSHFDFNVFWHSASALWDGSSIYFNTGAPDSSANPPIWTVLMSPLAFLEPITAYRLFVVLSIPVTIGYLVWMSSELKLGLAWALVGSSALLLSNPMLGTLAQGQVYTLLTLGLVAAWIAHQRDRTELSGVALGLVVAIKPFLAPVLLWPLIMKKWQMAVTAVLTGSASSLVADIIAGPGATLEWLVYVGARRPDAFWDSNTLPAAAARAFTENEFVEPVASLP